MASFVVMEPPEDDGTDAILQRDGFHMLAFLVPFLWLFWHRLWIEGAVALAVAVAIAWISGTSAIGGAAFVLSLLVSIYVGIEGPALRLAALRRRGWREWGVVEADNAADAETRYLAELGEEEAAAPAPWTRAHGPEPARSGGSVPAVPALGMFDYPGGR